jgi:phosphate transport system protein
MRHFDELLEELRNKLLEMSALVQTAIRESVRSLGASDQSEAQSVLKGESDVNRMELEIDQLVTELLALEQPVASDLRFITAAGKINNNLERIGDLAVNIAERAESLIQHPHVAVRTDIPKLAEMAESMVRMALDAFIKKDAEEARAVLVSERAINDLRDAIFNDLIRRMKSDSKAVQACVDLMFAARNLERIADHATNIAEAVVFMVEGVDLRHHQMSVGS